MEQQIDHDAQHLAETAAVLLGQNQQFQQQQTMSDDELKAIIASKISASSPWYGATKQGRDRVLADEYYRGEVRGDEIDGRSEVVSRDVAQAIDGMMPSLMDIFASGDQVVSFEPHGIEDEEAAEQATDYINWVFLQKNEGYRTLYTWFKDALLKKNGIVKCWYEQRTKRTKETYQGLGEAEFQAISSNPEISIVDLSQYPDPNYIPQPQLDPSTGQPVIDQNGQPVVPPPAMFYDCVVVQNKPECSWVVANVPPDEFLIERRAVSDDTATFLGHRSKRTINDLLECGYDHQAVMSIPYGEDQDYNLERLERFNEEYQLPAGADESPLNKLMRKVWVIESYVRVDYDGDGYAEWRKVTMAGDPMGSTGAILENIEVDDHPFATLTPNPEPHKFYGESLFDKTRDIQDVNTALLRQFLDSLYLSNNPRMGVVEGQANIDDLLDSRPGGLIRLKNPNAIIPVVTPHVGQHALDGIEYMNTVAEQRTGVTRYNQGLDADSLNKTATGINIIANAGQARLKMIARTFAETGVKRLFRILFKLVCEHENELKTVKLRNKWVNINPRDWKDRMDVTVSVGIGHGNRDQQAAIAMQLLNLDEKIIQLQGGVNGPLLTAKNVYNKLGKLVEAIGWKAAQPYYTDPDSVPPPEPKPDPEDKKLALEKYKIDTNATLEKYKIDSDVGKHMMNAHQKDKGNSVNISNVPEDIMGTIKALPDVVTNLGQQNADTMSNMAQQNASVLQSITDRNNEALMAVAKALSAPRRAVRDKNGRLTGTETVFDGR